MKHHHPAELDLFHSPSDGAEVARAMRRAEAALRKIGEEAQISAAELRALEDSVARDIQSPFPPGKPIEIELPAPTPGRRAPRTAGTIIQPGFGTFYPGFVSGLAYKGDLTSENVHERLLTRSEVPLEHAYIAPGGGGYFQDILNFGGPYFIVRIEPQIMRDHAAELQTGEGYHHIEYGPAQGHKTLLFNRMKGFCGAITLIDIAPAYLDETKMRLVANGMDPEKIQCVQADFTSPEFFAKIWPQIHEHGQGLPKTLTAFGNELQNHDIGAFLRETRKQLRAGDIFYIGVDSTWDEDTLRAAYTIKADDGNGHEKDLFEIWLRNGVGFTLKCHLGLRDFDPNRLIYKPDIATTASTRSVLFYMFMGAEQELFYRSPVAGSLGEQEKVAGWIEQSVDEIIAAKTNASRPSVKFERGARLLAGFSSRAAEGHYRNIFAEAGFSSLALKPHVPEGRVNYNIWALTPAI